MKKTKTQKGITLVALIITIIVLLILAVVTINAVKGDGIIQYAERARDRYTQEQTKEQEQLLKYEYEMAKMQGTATGSYDEFVLEKRYGLKIGDKVDYNEGSGYTSTIDSTFVMKNLEWRVLGINEWGEIELISTQPTESTLTLEGENGYLLGPTKLNTLCNDLYGNGIGAINARSLVVEDIDKLAGIITYEDKYLVGFETSIYQYRYSTQEGYMQYRTSTDKGITWGPEAENDGWVNITRTEYQSFKEPGGETISNTNYQDEEGNIKVVNVPRTLYSYILSKKTTAMTADGILISDLIKGLLDDNATVNNSPQEQWLASTAVSANSISAHYYVRFLTSSGNISSYNNIYSANGSVKTYDYVVRPVVTLSSNVQFGEKNENGAWTIENK